MNCISDQQQKVDDRVIYYRLYSGIPVIYGGEHVKDEIYQYWLTPEVISPFIEQAQSQLQQEQATALAKKLALEKAEKEKALTDVYNRREHYWQQAQEQADRTCASGYDAASRYLHQLFEAYQFKADEAVFEQRFKRFVVANTSRKALLNRLKSLLL